MWPGRDAGQKREIIESITRVFEGLRIPAEVVIMRVHHLPKDGWGQGGVPAADEEARQ